LPKIQVLIPLYLSYPSQDFQYTAFPIVDSVLHVVHLVKMKETLMNLVARIPRIVQISVRCYFWIILEKPLILYSTFSASIQMLELLYLPNEQSFKLIHPDAHLYSSDSFTSNIFYLYRNTHKRISYLQGIIKLNSYSKLKIDR